MVKVAFIHPDLGIGGAERLICDAALALQSSSHTVKIFTSHHDASHCFVETKDGSLDVEAVGDWLPRQLFNRFFAFCAYVRMLYVALYLTLASSFSADVIVVDQISACIPLLAMFGNGAKVVFYCHFPDMLLTQRRSWLKKLYRMPIDKLEEVTTGMADVVLVNSQFTSDVFASTFKSLAHIQPKILYPSLNTDGFNKDLSLVPSPLENKVPPGTEVVFLSINRYERKKNLALAILALKHLKTLCSDEQLKKVQLVIAGGYDDRVDENKEYHLELVRLSQEHELVEHVVFLRSFSDADKCHLLTQSTCLLYTPTNEHFGIVPIEAMYMKLPVIACSSGGPLETVAHEVTGYLCESSPSAFGSAMYKFVTDTTLKKNMGEAGHERVQKNFSFNSFTQNLHTTITDVLSTPQERYFTWQLILFSFTLLLLLLLFTSLLVLL